MSKLIFFLALLLSACTAGIKVVPGPDQNELAKALKPGELLAGVPGIDGYQVTFLRCGFENAFTVREDHEIIYCNELAAETLGTQRMVLLHEGGHVAFGSGIPFTGMEELAADEFAAVTSIWAGRADDVYQWANFWVNQGDSTDDGSDPHPSGDRRAMHAWHLYNGATEAPTSLFPYWNWQADRKLWLETSARWHKLLNR
jgi:hypothetical protein